METIAHYHFQTVHFPIALTLAGFFLMALGLIRRHDSCFIAARYVLYLATAGAVVAVSTGLLAENFIPHSHEGAIHEVMEWHETLGLWIAGSLIFTSVLTWLMVRKGYRHGKTITALLLLIISTLIGITGYLGGRLGHEFGIGLEDHHHHEESNEQEH